MEYKPCTNVLNDCDASLSKLAEAAYEQLSAEDRKAVDLLTSELSDRLHSKRGKAHGIGDLGMRELALALFVFCAENCGTMNQKLISGVKRISE